MVKTIISILVVALLITVGALLETDLIQRQFNELDQVLETLYDKIENETAVIEDAYAVHKNWLDKKKYLHIFIPHSEIKEIDLWLSESVILIEDNEWTDALSKIEVLQELCEQIPHTFTIAWENIL